MTRWHQRKHDAEVSAIVRKAKVDMARWVAALDYLPSENDLRIWQAGYLSGINRATGNSEVA
jgi:hypothetical protein